METNIAVVGCIHGDVENIMRFTEKMEPLNIDILVCPGDFTDYSLPRGFSRVDMGELILEELKSLGKPVVTVPGSWDKDLINLLKNKSASVHGTGKVVGGIGFYGYGGAKTPFNTPFEPAEGEIMLGLEKAYNEVKGSEIKIQVTHAPPLRSKLDTIGSGAHVGSEAVKNSIEKHKPNAAICAHIHESRGVEDISGTKTINPGRFPEGHIGLITINGPNLTAKVTNLM